MNRIKKVVNTKYVDNQEEFAYTFEPIEDTIKIKSTKEGFEALYLTYDTDPISPEEDQDNNLFLVAYHRDFDVRRDKVISKDLAVDIFRDEDTEEVKEFKKKYWCFGLEAYIHGGVSLAFSHCGNFPDRRWDVSQIGLVCVAKEEWKEEEKAEQAAKNHIEYWNQYLSGDVYIAVKETYDNEKEQCDYDCVCGYYGYENTVKELHDGNIF